MEKEKCAISSVAVFFVEFFDPAPGQLQQRFVFRQRFLRRVSKVSQQTEVQVGDPICEEPDFQGFGQILDVLSAAEHRRHYCQSAQFRRNPC